MINSVYEAICSSEKKMLAILIDPDKFSEAAVEKFLAIIPTATTHLFVGGSTVRAHKTETTVKAIKKYTDLPVVLFPGDYQQITASADALLFLSLVSGRNPEYLIGQQVKASKKLRTLTLEIIPTAYVLIDGGTQSAVARVSETKPMLQSNTQAIVDTAVAGMHLGHKLIYLEAGSGAAYPVSATIIKAVKKEVKIPLIVGGGIRTKEQLDKAFEAGADMVVMGTVFEEKI